MLASLSSFLCSSKYRPIVSDEDWLCYMLVLDLDVTVHELVGFQIQINQSRKGNIAYLGLCYSSFGLGQVDSDYLLAVLLRFRQNIVLVPLYWSLWCWCKLVLCYLYVTQFNKTHLLELVFDMCLFHKCTLQATVTQDAIIAQTAVYQMELYQNIFIWSLVGAISDNSCFYRPIFGFGHIAILSRLIRCKARYCFR